MAPLRVSGTSRRFEGRHEKVLRRMIVLDSSGGGQRRHSMLFCGMQADVFGRDKDVEMESSTDLHSLRMVLFKCSVSHRNLLSANKHTPVKFLRTSCRRKKEHEVQDGIAKNGYSTRSVECSLFAWRDVASHYCGWLYGRRNWPSRNMQLPTGWSCRRQRIEHRSAWSSRKERVNYEKC